MDFRPEDLFDLEEATLQQKSKELYLEWWSQSGSNRRPHPCKGCALPAELWPHFGMGRLPKS